jgi:hypothetical protein
MSLWTSMLFDMHCLSLCLALNAMKSAGNISISIAILYIIHVYELSFTDNASFNLKAVNILFLKDPLAYFFFFFYSEGRSEYLVSRQPSLCRNQIQIVQ